MKSKKMNMLQKKIMIMESRVKKANQAKKLTTMITAQRLATLPVAQR